MSSWNLPSQALESILEKLRSGVVVKVAGVSTCVFQPCESQFLTGGSMQGVDNDSFGSPCDSCIGSATVVPKMVRFVRLAVSLWRC